MTDGHQQDARESLHTGGTGMQGRAMNILFVSHRLPYPPSDGARIRAFHMIRHLAARGDVTVATLSRSPAEYAAGQGLAKFCRRLIVQPISAAEARLRMICALAGPGPSSMGYFRSPALQRRIDAELRARPYQLAVVHSSTAAPYVEDAPVGAKLLDFVDMDSQKWLAYGRMRRFPLSAGYWLEGTKLQRAEAALAGKFEMCTCITPAELATLQSFGTAARSDWFPNGVDLEYFAPPAGGQASYDDGAICFVGRMDYYPNVQAMVRFCREVLPIIRRQRPDASLTIVGAEPVPAVRRLARQPGVTVTGTVPDVRPYLRRAAVSVAPLQIARGMQNKILEAMASGVPVVASRLAAGGIDAQAAQHLVAADTAEEIAAALLRLMSSAAERDALSRSARRSIEQRYSWRQAMQRFDAFIASALHARRGVG